MILTINYRPAGRGMCKSAVNGNQIKILLEQPGLARTAWVRVIPGGSLDEHDPCGRAQPVGKP
jgi:hypothetical protein